MKYWNHVENSCSHSEFSSTVRGRKQMLNQYTVHIITAGVRQQYTVTRQLSC